MASLVKEYNIEIPETVRQNFCWEIKIPSISRLENHQKELEKLHTKAKYAKVEQTFDTGILEDVPNYGSFSVNCRKLNYSLELVESINPQTVVSVKDCQIKLYLAECYSDSKSVSSVTGGFCVDVSPRQEACGNPVEIRKFMRWFGEYNIPVPSPVGGSPWYYYGHQSVNKIQICWVVQRVTDGRMIDKSSLKKNEVVPQLTVDKQWSASSYFFGSKNLSDVIFVCDGTEFPSHRFVLSAKSPVFRRMLDPDCEMKEAEEGRITIVDIKPKIFKEFLRFLYCGTVDKLGAVSKELIYAAEKYDVQLLKKICEKSLVDQVTKKNAVEMYCMGESLRAASLMEKALKTMKTNKTKVFRNSKSLLEFTQRHPDVMLKIVNS